MVNGMARLRLTTHGGGSFVISRSRRLLSLRLELELAWPGVVFYEELDALPLRFMLGRTMSGVHLTCRRKRKDEAPRGILKRRGALARRHHSLGIVQ